VCLATELLMLVLLSVQMGTETVPETSVIFNQVTRLTAREDSADVSHSASFTPYTVKVSYVPDSSRKCKPVTSD